MSNKSKVNKVSKAMIIDSSGIIVKRNRFSTDKGTYDIAITSYQNELYFLKKLNDKIVECKKLSPVIEDDKSET